MEEPLSVAARGDGPTIIRVPTSLPGAVPGGGWNDAARAMHAVQQLGVPMLMMVQPDGFPPIHIDFSRRSFHWRVPMEAFPPAPAFVQVESEPLPPGDTPPFRSAPRPLDALLWAVGQVAFDGARAPWLKPGERYRLASWPNLTGFTHSFDHMRMTAQLGNGFATVDELTQTARTEPEAAQRMINAYSLLGILRIGEPDVVRAPRSSPVGRVSSLISRLRSTWGM